MTRGYPDFLKIDSVEDDPIVLQANANTPSGYVSQLVECSRWQAARIYFAPTVVAWQIQIDWFGDAAATIPMGSEVWHVAAGRVLQVTLAHRGNWFRVTLNSSDAAAHNTTLIVANTLRQLQPQGWVSPPELVATGNVNVNAGATSSFGFGFPYSGDVDYQIGTSAAAWGFEFLASTYLGVTTRLRSVGAVGAAQTFDRMYVPPKSNFVTVTNNDGGVRVFNITVVPLLVGS